ncbi:hypothetical protein ACLKA6_007807 [Drosophila palustris]
MQYQEDAETVQQVRHIQGLIRDRIGQSATRIGLQPLWYRCLSDSQMEAADSLQVALGDDILEGTTYRVNSVLHRLGVHPRPPKSGLRRLFPISRGNDVAFVWFLMEAYYTSQNHDNFYSSNEQILMSTIFWLDLFPTLRELDRVLPLPHPSAETRRKEIQAETHRIQRAQREKRKAAQKRQSTHSTLPYFENPLRPKIRRRNLFGTSPGRPATLPIVPSKTPSSTLGSRWFGDFVFDDGNRIAKTVLQKEVDNILSSLQAAKLNSSQVEIMCTHHKMVNEVENSLRLNLEKIKQEKRNELLSTDYRTKERNRQRILEQLDRMTEYYRRQFHDMAIKTRMTSTRKRLCAETFDTQLIYVDNGDGDSMDWSEDVKLLEGCQPLPPTCRDNTPNPKLNPNRNESEPGCKCTPNRAKAKPTLSHRPSTLMRFLRLGGTEMEMGKEQKCEQNSLNQCSSHRECNKYFEWQHGNIYRFSYQKLFAPCKSKLLNSDQLRLRAEFLKALDADVEYLNAVLEGERSGSMDSLVDRSAKRIFREGTELFQQEYDRLKAEKKARMEPEYRLDFGQKYYDADNIELMKQMLRVGLDRVAQDRRYILPTLPEVHSVPLLIKWICTRYGKLYTAAERKHNYNQAKNLMNDLMFILTKEIVRSQCRRPIALPRQLSSIREQNKISRMLKLYWTHFTKYFVLSMMELGRIFHSTMEADPGTKSTSLYYAYMPAHIKDIEFSQPIY